MAGQGFTGECACGGIDFERIGLARPSGSAYVTDMVACNGCGAVYLDPTHALPPAPMPPGHSLCAGQALQPTDSNEALRRDAIAGAKDYVKPGRHTPPRHKR